MSAQPDKSRAAIFKAITARASLLFIVSLSRDRTRSTGRQPARGHSIPASGCRNACAEHRFRRRVLADSRVVAARAGHMECGGLDAALAFYVTAARAGKSQSGVVAAALHSVG